MHIPGWPGAQASLTSHIHNVPASAPRYSNYKHILPCWVSSHVILYLWERGCIVHTNECPCGSMKLILGIILHRASSCSVREGLSIKPDVPFPDITYLSSQLALSFSPLSMMLTLGAGALPSVSTFVC